MGVASLILGIVALALCWIPIVGYVAAVLGVIGIILGIIALINVGRNRATNRIVSVLGLITSVAAVVLSFVVFFAFANAMDKALTGAGTTALVDESASPAPEASVDEKPVDEAPETEAPPPPPELTYYTPVAKDFKLTVKVLSKKCFGSAGCNITFRVVVAYSGEPIDPSESYEVIYDVKGGEEPYTNTLTVTGDESSVDSEESISTEDKTDTISAVVTEVL